jgi:hypothetical protein
MPCMRGWNHFAMPHASILHIIPWYTICSIYTPWYTMVDPMRVTAISTHRPGASAPFWGTRNGGEPKLSQWWRTFWHRSLLILTYFYGIQPATIYKLIYHDLTWFN